VLPTRRSHHRGTAHPLAALLGAHIRKLRIARGFSFDAFAEELGRGYVSDLERGKVVPTFATLAKVAELLELEVADLVALTPSPRLELLALTRELTPVQVRRLLREATAMAERKDASAPKALVLNPARKPRTRTE
jgi:transcriptional regulator with XRE-family HTH domain